MGNHYDGYDGFSPEATKTDISEDRVTLPKNFANPACNIALVDTANPKDALGLAKTPLRLFPPTALVMGSHVMALGAKKYGEYNWRKNAVKHSVYLEAAMRHIIAAADGEKFDPESGLSHEAHAMMCMAILIDANETGSLIDDRNVSCVVQDMMDRLVADE